MIPLGRGGGVLLVSEKPLNSVTVLDGWRTKFNRGDANADGRINLTDANFIFNWLFSNGGPSPCYDAADMNDDAIVNITDGNNLLNFLFLGGPPPAPPFFGTQLNAGCGFDPTIDILGCGGFTSGCAITF